MSKNGEDPDKIACHIHLNRIYTVLHSGNREVNGTNNLGIGR